MEFVKNQPFQSNTYNKTMFPLYREITEEGQSQSVKRILERFSKGDTNIGTQRKSVSGFQLSQDSQVGTTEVDTLFDTPDLQFSNEMDAIDGLKATTIEPPKAKASKVDDKKEDNKKEPETPSIDN